MLSVFTSFASVIKISESSNVYFLSKLISGLSIYAYKYHCVLIALESITKNVIFSFFLPRTCGFWIIIGLWNSILEGALTNSRLPYSINLSIFAVWNFNKSKFGKLFFPLALNIACYCSFWRSYCWGNNYIFFFDLYHEYNGLFSITPVLISCGEVSQ